MPNLNLNMDIVREIVNHIRELHAKESVVIPSDVNELSEDDFMQILADHNNDLTWLDLKAAIDGLEPDQRLALIAIMYLGRGDFDLDEWQECVEAAKIRGAHRVAEYLIAHPLSSDHLENGLTLLGYEADDSEWKK